MKKINNKYILSILIISFISLIISLISIFSNLPEEKYEKNLINKKEQERIVEKYYATGSASVIYSNDLTEPIYAIYGVTFDFDYLKLKNIFIEIYAYNDIFINSNFENPLLSFTQSINVDHYEIYATGIENIGFFLEPVQYQTSEYYALHLTIVITTFGNNEIIFEDTFASTLLEFPNSNNESSSPSIYGSVTKLEFNSYFLDNLINAEYENGYQAGFNDGTRNCSTSEFSLEWLIEVFRVVERFLDVELLPGFTIKLVILIPLVLSLLYALLKMLR